jgi:hypothetical protein
MKSSFSKLGPPLRPVDPRLRLNFDVFNLFNRQVNDIDYYYASQLRGELAPVNNVHFHPAEPRSVRVALIGNFLVAGEALRTSQSAPASAAIWTADRPGDRGLKN